jgi:hypothetical protein
MRANAMQMQPCFLGASDPVDPRAKGRATIWRGANGPVKLRGDEQVGSCRQAPSLARSSREELAIQELNYNRRDGGYPRTRSWCQVPQYCTPDSAQHRRTSQGKPGFNRCLNHTRQQIHRPTCCAPKSLSVLGLVPNRWPFPDVTILGEI